MLNFNGKIIEDTSGELSFENRGLQYGDALFETIKVSAGKVLFWEDHYFRLMASMRILRMEIPMSFTPEYLELEILRTTNSQTRADAYRVKILVWRKPGGKYTPDNLNVEFAILAEAIDTPFYTIADEAYEIELYKDHFVQSGLLSTLKTTNRIINILGGIYAHENEHQNCLLLNEKKQVVEALNGNIFTVTGYKIKTPPLSDGCLNGIMRKQVISVLAHWPDYILEEESISPFELQKADEIFITNVIQGIQPITKYRKKEFSEQVARELIGKINAKARFG